MGVEFNGGRASVWEVLEMLVVMVAQCKCI